MNWIVWFSVFVVTFDPSVTQRRAIVSYPVTVAPPGPTKSSIQPTATRPPSRPPAKGDPSPDPRIAPDALKPVYDSGYRSGSTTNSSSSSRPSNDDRGEKDHRPYPDNLRGDPKNRPDEPSRGSESILTGRESSLPKGDFGSTGRSPSKPPARPLPLTPLNREASQGSKGSDIGIDRDGVRKSEDGDRSSARDAPSRDDRPRLPLERETRPKTDETDYRLRGTDRGKPDADTPARDADDHGSSYPRTDRRPPVRDDYDEGRSRDRDFRDDEDSYDKGRSKLPRDGERSSSDRDYADREAYDERRKADRDDHGRDDDRRSYPPPRDYDKGRAPSIDDRRSDRDRDYRDRDRDLPPRRDRPRYDGDYEKGIPPVSRDRDTYDEGRRLSDRGYSDKARRYDDEKSRRDPDYGGLRDAEPRSRDEDKGRDYYDDEGYRDRRRPQGSRRVSSDDDDDEYYRRRERPTDTRRKGDDSAYYDDRRSYGEDKSRDRIDDDRYIGRDYSRDSEVRYRSTSRSRRPEDDDGYRSRDDDDKYRSREDDDRYADRRHSDSRDDGYRDRDRRVDERRTRVDDRSSDRTLPDSDREEYSVRSRPDRPIDDRDRPLPALSEDRYRSDSLDDVDARKRTDPRDDPPRDLPRPGISLRTIPERPKSNTPDDRYRDTPRDRERPSSYDRDDDYRRDSDPPRSRDDKDRRDEPSGEGRYRDRSDRPYDDRYKVTSSRRSEESVGSRTREDSRYVDDRRDRSRSREPNDDKYYRDIESSRGRTDDFSDKGEIRSEDDYRRDNERTRSASSSERDVILSTRYPVTDKDDSKGSKPDDGYLRSRSYSSSESGYDERDRRYSETSRSETPRISSSRSRPRLETYPSSYDDDEEKYRERPSSRYDRDDYRKGDSEVRSDEERYRYRRKSVTEDEYRNAQEERYRRERTRLDQISGSDRDSGGGRYDEKGVRYYEERFADNAKGYQEERRMYFADEERKDASDDKGRLGISYDESDRDGDSTNIRNSDSDYKPGSRSREPTHNPREEPKATEDSMHLQSSRHEKGAESRYPTISGRETVKHTTCNEETESLVRDSNPSFPKSSSVPESSMTSSRGSSGYDCSRDHVHLDSTREHASRSKDTADHAETFTGSRGIYPTRSFADPPSSKSVRSTAVYDQSSSSSENGGNREDQKVHQVRSNSSHGSGDSENKYKKGISIPSDEQTRNTPRTTVITSDPSERPLTLKEVIEAAYRHPESPAPKGEVYYPVYDPRINNITSPEIIRPSERRGITISTRKRRK